MSTNFVIRQIVDATEDEIDKGALVLARAFENDEFASVIAGRPSNNDLQKSSKSKRAMIVAFLTGGIMYYAFADDGEVIGVTGWFPPGKDFPALKRPSESPGGNSEGTDQPPPEARAYWSDKLRPAFMGHVDAILGGADFKLNNWYLHTIAISPERQQQGVGTALIKIGEEQARAEGKAVVLQSTSETIAMRFYKGLGYKVIPSGYAEHPDYRIFEDHKGNYGFKLFVFVKEF